MKILYILDRYPVVTESYVTTELNHIYPKYEVMIITLNDYRQKYVGQHFPYTFVKNRGMIDGIIKSFNPDYIHSHFLHMIELLDELGKPYTIRSHVYEFNSIQRHSVAPFLKNKSKFDNLPKLLDHYSKLSKGPNCRGILVFPIFRKLLEGYGIQKLFAAPPVVDISLFLNYEPHKMTGRILCIGSCWAKKAFRTYIDLAKRHPNLTFNLYTDGGEIDALRQYNKLNGNPVNILNVVPHKDMPKIYRDHDYLIYTACPNLKQAGMPMVVCEAQASGIGVCLQNIHVGYLDYLDGGGYLFNNIMDLSHIIQTPYPDNIREKGIINSQKYDISTKLHILTDLWI